MKLFVLNNVPGALPVGQEAEIPTMEWLSVCHTKARIIFVDYEQYRELSRWTHAERKRPFLVRNRQFEILGSSTTLDGALKILREQAAYYKIVD